MRRMILEFWTNAIDSELVKPDDLIKYVIKELSKNKKGNEE